MSTVAHSASFFCVVAGKRTKLNGAKGFGRSERSRLPLEAAEVDSLATCRRGHSTAAACDGGGR
jgi:hypothetical protein